MEEANDEDRHIMLFFHLTNCPYCHDCPEFHDNVLAHKDVLTEMKPYTVVRLDTNAKQAIIDPKGNKTTTKAMSETLKMTYRPGVAIYDEGKLVRRADSLLYSFHFKEGLRYISGGYYQTESYRSYAEKRHEELLSAGVSIYLGKQGNHPLADYPTDLSPAL